MVEGTKGPGFLGNIKNLFTGKKEPQGAVGESVDTYKKEVLDKRERKELTQEEKDYQEIMNQPAKPSEPAETKKKAKPKKLSVENIAESLNSKEKIREMAQNIIENGLNSSYLSPSSKHESIKDYLKQELSVDVDIDKWEQIGEFDDMDKIISLDWKNALLKNAKKLGWKTVVGAGVGGAAALALMVPTKGLSIKAFLWGLGGTSGGRLLMEGAKSGFDIWGKGKELRMNLAKDYLINSLEAQKKAQEIIDAMEGNDEKFWLSARELINTIYGKQSKDASEALKGMHKGKEDLEHYENNWNTATEIVAFAGGAGATAAYGLTRGVEELAAQKLKLAAEGKLAINLDANPLMHFVKKIGSVWRFILKPEDIAVAKAQFGAHWANFLHQASREVGKAGVLHMSELSEAAIKQYLASESYKEIVTKLLPMTAAGLLTGNAAAWGYERINIGKKFGVDVDKNVNRELIQKHLMGVIDREVAKLKTEGETLKETDSLGEAKVGDIFVYENQYKEKFRVKVINLDGKAGKLTIEPMDKKEDGTSYAPDEIEINIKNDVARKVYNKRITPWNERQEYSYKDWQKIEKFLIENKDKIEKLDRGKILKFRKDADIATIGLDPARIDKYEFYNLDKESNKIFITDTDKGYTPKSLIKADLSNAVGLLSPEVAAANEEKKEPANRLKKLTEQFNGGKHIIEWYPNVPDEFYTNNDIKKTAYEVEAINTTDDKINLIEPDTGAEKNVSLSAVYTAIKELKTEVKPAGAKELTKEDIDKQVKQEIQDRKNSGLMAFPSSLKFQLNQKILYGGIDYIITSESDDFIEMMQAKKTGAGDFEMAGGFNKLDENSLITIDKVKLAKEFEAYKGMGKVKK